MNDIRKRREEPKRVCEGGLVSSTFVLLFIIDLSKVLPKGIKDALYADDLVMCKLDYMYIGTAKVRIQEVVDRLATRAIEWM